MIMKKYLLPLIIILFLASPVFGAAPTVVSTFESMGVSWTPSGGGGDACTLQYKVNGAGSYEDAQNMVWDSDAGEYRGSIVGLTPNTNYDIFVDNGTDDETLSPVPTTSGASGSNTTWSETFSVGATTTLDASYGETYTIGTSGTEDSYHLYDCVANSTVIDVNNSGPCIDTNDKDYIIIRGCTLVDGQYNGIVITDNSNDIIIENNDISGWGRQYTAEDAGIKLEGTSYVSDATRIIIQRNLIHDPRYDAQTREEGYPNSGASGIHANSTVGNSVIRYNSFYCDGSGQCFEDAIAGWDNFARFGSPGNFGRDTDIYGNYIMGTMDDGIELEGNNENNRIWGNYIKGWHMQIAAYTCAVGPMYIFRNIVEGVDTTNWETYYHGGFLKVGASESYDTDGRIFVYHNTMLRPGSISNKLIGMAVGIGAGYNYIDNLVSKNNILHTYDLAGISADNYAFYDNGSGTYHDWDYDMYNGSCSGCSGQESNGISGTSPTFNPTPTYNIAAPGGSGTYTLASAAPGYDDGVVLNNFNDGYEGAGPDIGAMERGSDPMEFGVEAYLGISNISPSDGGTGVSATVDLTWTNPVLATGIDVYFDESSCPAAVPTLVVDDSLVETYDPGTLSFVTTYCFRIDMIYDGGIETGDNIEFTTTTGPPPPPTGLSTCSYHSLGMTGVYDDQGATVGQ